MLSVTLSKQQFSLLAALANRMQWAFEPRQQTEVTMHFAGFSAGSYTAIALEVDYRLLCQHFQQPLCPGTTTVGALRCPMQHLVALLSPAFQLDTACLLSAQRTLRISHVWKSLRAQDTRPALLIQVLDSRDTEWLEWLGREKQLRSSASGDHSTQFSLSGSESHAEGPCCAFCRLRSP